MTTKLYHVAPDVAGGEPLLLGTVTIDGNTGDLEPVWLCDQAGNVIVIDGTGKIGINNFPAFPTDQLVNATNLDITLTSLADLIKSGKTLADIVTALGSVAVTGSFWQATQPVSGTFWQATQPTSLTPKQLSTDTVTITASGDTVAHATTAGKTLQIYCLKLSADGNNGPIVLAATRIGTIAPTTSAKVDLQSMSPAQVVAANIGAEYGGGPAFVAGAVSDNLIVNLSAAATVYATLRYLEV